MNAKKSPDKTPKKRVIQNPETVQAETVEADTVEKSTQLTQVDTGAVVVGESWLSNKQVEVLKKTILKNFTPEEMGLTFHMAKAIGANIFARELWAFKDNKGNLVNVIARDFLRKKAYENPEFSSFQSGAVFEHDEFEMNQATGYVNHVVKFAFKKDKRGVLKGAWCVGTFRDGTKVWYLADLEVYKPKNPSTYSPWHDQDADMIIKCAEAVILKKFARLGNVYTEEEIEHLRNDWPREIARPKKPDVSKLDNLGK